jgi:hypothetical protein
MSIFEMIFGKPKPRKKKVRKIKLDFEEDEQPKIINKTEPITMDNYTKKFKPVENDEEPNFGEVDEVTDKEELKEFKRVMKPKKPVIIKPKGKMFVSINKANRVSLVISAITICMTVFLFIGSFTNANMASGSGLIMIIFAILNMYINIKYMLYRLQVEVVEDELFE